MSQMFLSFFFLMKNTIKLVYLKKGFGMQESTRHLVHQQITDMIESGDVVGHSKKQCMTQKTHVVGVT